MFQFQPRHITYALQESFKKELEHQQEKQIILPLGGSETPDWCNTFVLVPKLNATIYLYLDQERLNQALIRSVCRGPIANDISKLTEVHYLTLIDASSDVIASN